MTDVMFVKELFKKNDIEYEEWHSDQDEYEIRIDLSELNEKQFKTLEEEFDVLKKINEKESYDYIIFLK